MFQQSDFFRQQAYLAGAWCDADDGSVVEVFNPSTGERLGSVPAMGSAETRRAIAAAHAALPAWRACSARERATLLRRWFDLCIQHKEALGRILSLEQGKPLAEAVGEIVYGSSFIEWFGEEARRVYGDVIQANTTDRRILVQTEPIGVVGVITPWNFPNAMITRKVGAALAAGCTVVVKPAVNTPFSALALVDLALRAGIPPGVLNVVTGQPADIGRELTSSPIVRKISFTGSTAVGRLLLAQCAPTIKKVTLELGGNAPFLIFDDADLDLAVKGVMASKFRNAGQTCVCANRILVQAGIYDAFLARLRTAVSALVVGDGLTPGVTIGPLIDARAVAKAEAHIADALQHGAQLVHGGARHALGGNFFTPTILTGLTPAMRIFSEETFGPVAPVMRFETEAEALALANDTESGLAAYFYTTDHRRIWRLSEALQLGIVGVNEGMVATEVAPFGGCKQSGIGREGSKYGISDYLNLKYICHGNVG